MSLALVQKLAPLQLNRLLASNASADEDDVLNVKQRLNVLGHYEVPSYGMTRYLDRALFEGIRSLQKTNGLDIDGYMMPEGETETALNKAMTQASLNQNAKQPSQTVSPLIVQATPQLQATQAQTSPRPQPQTPQKPVRNSIEQKYQQGNIFAPMSPQTPNRHGVMPMTDRDLVQAFPLTDSETNIRLRKNLLSSKIRPQKPSRSSKAGME